MLSNNKKCERWDMYQSGFYRWRREQKVTLSYLEKGYLVNKDRKDYPLITSDGALETTCNDRGFTIAEICRVTKVSRNTLKNWMTNTKRIVRFWDLVEGYGNAIISRD